MELLLDILNTACTAGLESYTLLMTSHSTGNLSASGTLFDWQDINTIAIPEQITAKLIRYEFLMFFPLKKDVFFIMKIIIEIVFYISSINLDKLIDRVKNLDDYFKKSSVENITKKEQ